MPSDQYSQQSPGIIRKRKSVGLDLAGNFFANGGSMDAKLRIERFGVSVDYLSVTPFDSADFYYYPAAGDGNITYNVKNNQALIVGAGFYVPKFLGGKNMYLGGGIGIYNYKRYEITASSSYSKNSISSTTVALKLQLRSPEWGFGNLGISADVTALLAPPVEYDITYALLPSLHLGKVFTLYARLGLWNGSGHGGFTAGAGMSLKFN